MRDPDFMVSAVLESDVIHANRKDVPCIFRIATSMLDPPGLKSITLMMVDRESEKNKWVDALAELHRILKRNKLSRRRLVEPKQLLDSTLSIIKNCLSAVIISKVGSRKRCLPIFVMHYLVLYDSCVFLKTY